MVKVTKLQLDTINDIVTQYMLKQADPGGVPSHGRTYGIDQKLNIIKQHGQRHIVSNVLHANLSPEAKADILMFYADALFLEEKGITEPIIDVTSFISSLSPDGRILPDYPIWCLPDFVPIMDTKDAAERHYINRQKAIMTLGRAGDGSTQLYRFINNFYDYFYIDSECLCNLLISGKKNRLRVDKTFGKGKVGQAILVKDQQDRPRIMKVIGGVSKSGFTLSLKKSVERNPTTSLISHEGTFVAAGSGDFVNQTVIHLLLNLLLDDNPNFVYQYDAFFCGSNGVNIMDIANQGDMYAYLMTLSSNDDRVNACDACLLQLLPIIAYLKKPEIGFTHNDLKLKNIFVHKTPSGEIIYRLADFDKSAINWRNVRFYNNQLNYGAGVYVKYNGYSVHELRGGIISSYSRNTDLIGKTMAQYTMYNPHGYYLMYDIYTLVTSMLFFPKIDIRGSLLEKTMHALDVGYTYIKTIDKYTSNGRKSTDEDLQRLTIINGILHKNEIILKNDLNGFMKDIGLKDYTPESGSVSESFFKLTADKSHIPIISKSGKICLTEPYMEKGQLQCDTQPYRSLWGKQYTTDYVNNK